jgi:hypothetical protein
MTFAAGFLNEELGCFTAIAKPVPVANGAASIHVHGTMTATTFAKQTASGVRLHQ